LRPIFHHKAGRIEVHLIEAFLAYCRTTTLRQRLRALAGRLMLHVVLEKLATVHLLDVTVPTTEGRELGIVRLGWQLPKQPPPRLRTVGGESKLSQWSGDFWAGGAMNQPLTILSSLQERKSD
jgi:hypothetical protein